MSSYYPCITKYQLLNKELDIIKNMWSLNDIQLLISMDTSKTWVRVENNIQFGLTCYRHYKFMVQCRRYDDINTLIRVCEGEYMYL